MRNIITLSKREITRLRTRFTGRSRLLVLSILLIAAISSYVIYHQDLVISKGLYAVGVSGDGPSITDKRFHVVQLDRKAGYNLLQEGAIDVYVDAKRIVSSGNQRSQYAAGALRQYLEKQELLRISSQYGTDRAFPLRVEVSYIKAAPGSSGVDMSPPRNVEAKDTTVTPEQPAPSLPEPSATPPEPAMTSVPVLPPQTTAGNSDDAVRQQLANLGTSNRLPEFKAEFVSENEIIIPSLMNPPLPLAQVTITFLYIVPIFFVSLFFTSSFTEEKVNRKLIVLLSAPVTRLQVILGKMLPYLGYSIGVIVLITLALKGNILLGLIVFTPVMLFIFSLYLMVALTYRTFKDQTFFSVLALSVIAVYLIGPAMFTGVSDLSYISPLTLAVQMYRGESFGVAEYFLATAPLYLVFLQMMFIGARVFNEEYLMGFKPLHVKVADALYLAMDRSHLNVSVLLLSLFLVPAVFVVQLVSIVFASNLPMPFTLWFLLIVSAAIEEIAKSTGIVVLLRNRTINTGRTVITLSLLSALGFLLGEKLLLYLALSVLSESIFTTAVLGAGLLVVPLILHVVSTSIICLLTMRLGMKYYPLAIMAGTAAHFLYNLYVIGAIL